MAKRSETDLVRAVLVFLKARRIAAHRLHCGQIHRKNLHMNLGPEGWPDIIGYLPDGRFFGLECKLPGVNPTSQQKQRGEDIIACYGCWGIVRSVKDAESLIDQWLSKGKES